MDINVAVDLLLPPSPSSAGEARRLVRDAMTPSEVEEVLDAALVAVSEIVTNALVHAGTPMRLRVLRSETGIRVELTDGSPRLPQPRYYSPRAATGRGLRIVDNMVDRWGAYTAGDGKVVWFEITDASDEDELADDAREPVTEVDTPVRVELLNVPLLMHRAWQEHASALLRELLLVELAEDDSALERHAAASDALGVLFQQVPAPDIGDDPSAIMSSATDPGVSLARLWLEVPRGSVDHFRVLDEMLVKAIDLADRGELFYPPTQPEMATMRRWICRQVLDQGSGGASAAWVSPVTADPPPSLTELDWDPAPVEASTTALLAADDASRIVAASPAALALLGYDHGELVGRRLISIIPARYHQAHTAGFTLHLANGRAPMLGRRIDVPVLRADGSETVLGLVIESHSPPSGRKVFVAEFLS